MSRGIPTTAELLEAVRGFLREDVVPQTDGALSFQARVAANALAIVLRELELGPAYEAAQATRLEQLGVADDAALAAAIRAGELADREDELVALLREQSVERLRIDNPRYLLEQDRG